MAARRNDDVDRVRVNTLAASSWRAAAFVVGVFCAWLLVRELYAFASSGRAVELRPLLASLVALPFAIMGFRSFGRFLRSPDGCGLRLSAAGASSPAWGDGVLNWADVTRAGLRPRRFRQARCFDFHVRQPMTHPEGAPRLPLISRLFGHRAFTLLAFLLDTPAEEVQRLIDARRRAADLSGAEGAA